MKNIITIGREYGSGGYEVAEKLAKELGWDFYYRDLIAQLAEKTMMPESIIAETIDKPIRRNIFKETFPIFANDEDRQEQYIFEQQGRFLNELAEKGNCIIIGRRADYYLRNNPNAMHLYLYADLDFRAERIAKAENCSIAEAKEKIALTDKRRKTSYEYTTGRKWGDMHNYDRMICTSTFGIDKAVEEIVNLLK